MRRAVAKLLKKLTTDSREYRNFKKFWTATPRNKREALKFKFEKEINEEKN